MKRIKGMNRDVDPIDQPQGTYREALNALLTKRKGAVGSEEGTDSGVDISATYPNHTIIGDTSTYDGRQILFLADSNDGNGNSAIIVYKDGVITEVLSDSRLAFENDSVLETVSVIDNKDNLIVYWTDNINPPRFINIDEVIQTPGFNIGDINELNIFSTIASSPVLELSSVQSGGSLVTGAYHFAVRLIANDGSETGFMNVTPPVYINDEADVSSADNYDGVISGTSTNKSILLRIKELDQNYSTFEVVAIRKQNNTIAEVRILEEQAITDSSTTIQYNGGEEGLQSSIEEVLINTASYKTAKTIAEIDNTLYMGNLSQVAPINYQKYANNIVVSSTQKAVDGGGSGIKGRDHYGNPTVSFYDKSFKRGEVYALYVTFMLENGTESDAFHIPGRVAEGTEKNVVAGDLADIDPNGSEYQFLSTSGTNNMAYWENEEETYPTSEEDEDGQWEVWNVNSSGIGEPIEESPGVTKTLHGQKVRHHHFPDDSKPYQGGDSSKPHTLGFTLSNIKIPANILGKVRALKVYYAKRSTNNRRILDQGFLFPLKFVNLESQGPFYSYQPQALGGFGTVNAGIMHGFHSIRTKQDIGTASYIKLVNEPYGDASNPTNSGDDDEAFFDQMETINDPPASKFFPISGKTYVEKNSLQEATNAGLDFDVYNEEGEEGIALQFSNPIDFSHITSYSNSAHDISVGFTAELCTVRNNLYRPFNLQELVWTGKIITDLSNFDARESSSGSNATKASGQITITSGTGDVEVGPSDTFNVQNAPTGASGDCSTAPDTYIKWKGVDYCFELNTSMNKSTVATVVVNHINSNIPGLSAVNNGGTDPQIKVSSTELGTEDEGESVILLVPSAVETDPIFSQYTMTLAGGVDITDIIVTLSGESIPVSVSSNQTIATVASAINSAINDKSINYNSSVATDTISITANEIGTQYNGIITLSFGNTQAAGTDTELTGGTGDTSLQQFTLPGIYGGDTFISRHGTRRTGWLFSGIFDQLPVEPYRHLIEYVVESYDNIKLRHEGVETWQIYYPKSLAKDVLRIEDNFPADGIGSANYLGYNSDYSALADIKSPSPLQKVTETITKLPTRIIRSLQGDVNLREDEGLRTFLENDFIDLTRTRGELVTLSVIDSVLIPHMQRAMIRTKGREEMLVGDIRAFVGAGDIFAVSPDEIISTKNGFAGLQDQRCAIVTPYGYFFVDRDAGKVFLVSDKPEAISDNGLNNYFQEKLANITGEDQLICTFDNKWDRIILSYKGDGVAADAWTISYYPQLGIWGSFHSYTPEYFFYDIETFYAKQGDAIYEHNVEGNPCGYYGTDYTLEFDFIENRLPRQTKVFGNIQFITEVEQSDGTVIFNESFDQYRVYNDLQDSGVKNTSYFTNADGNMRNVEGTWKINDFRNMLVNGAVDNAKPWQNQDRIRGKWAGVRLIFNNTANKSLYLYDTDMGIKRSHR